MKPMLEPSLDEIRERVKGLTPSPIGRYEYYSVLIPLVEREEGLRVLFEVRADSLRRQPGEISFPGGKIEGDETPETCAVREACEELQIPRDAIEVIGELNYLITYSNSAMYAFLGLIDADALSRSHPNAAEVKRVFEAPLRFFSENDPETYVNEIRPVIAKGFPLEKIPFKTEYRWRTGTATVPIYTYRDTDSGEEFVIWGLTARLTQDFVEAIKG
ncbi:MAG: CoA pyrophosphatase [Clostridiales Family XIII bacterium]|jgi:8-oxo-dGTP pyrophosphatase MutT (NUDIX family)|nr:CoA pyrophosphatase [Clostridiales Family XIII bacterium]